MRVGERGGEEGGEARVQGDRGN
uniref:Uncharacterized protein n=1 Tax=Arundo donax TaxID=35708 RepID=A0A0A9GDB7_ARUDO